MKFRVIKPFKLATSINNQVSLSVNDLVEISDLKCSKGLLKEGFIKKIKGKNVNNS